jgi:hypothetical protein
MWQLAEIKGRTRKAQEVVPERETEWSPGVEMSEELVKSVLSYLMILKCCPCSPALW